MDAWSTVEVVISPYCVDYQSKILSAYFLRNLYLSLTKRKKDDFDCAAELNK